MKFFLIRMSGFKTKYTENLKRWMCKMKPSRRVSIFKQRKGWKQDNRLFSTHSNFIKGIYIWALSIHVSECKDRSCFCNLILSVIFLFDIRGHKNSRKNLFRETFQVLLRWDISYRLIFWNWNKRLKIYVRWIWKDVYVEIQTEIHDTESMKTTQSTHIIQNETFGLV